MLPTEEGKPTNCDPELPEHDKSTTDAGRGHLSRIDGNGGVLGSDADAHDKACCEEALPRLGETRTDRGRYQAAGSDKDLASSSEVVVQGIDNKGATKGEGLGHTSKPWCNKGSTTYMRPAVRKMMELMIPIVQGSSSMPNSLGNDKLAPLAPV